MEITGMTITKLPVLAPRRSRHVLLLPFALNVSLSVFRGVEYCFRLLRCHPWDRLRGRSLVLTLRWRRARGVTLSAASAPSTTSTSTSAASLFLPQRQLIIPPRIGVGDGNLENLFVAIKSAVQRNIRRIFGAPPLDQIVEAKIESRMVTYLPILRIGSASERRDRGRKRIAKKYLRARIVKRDPLLVAFLSAAGNCE